MHWQLVIPGLGSISLLLLLGFLMVFIILQRSNINYSWLLGFKKIISIAIKFLSRFLVIYFVMVDRRDAWLGDQDGAICIDT